MDHRHDIGVLASAALGAPVKARYVREAIASLYRAGLIPRTSMSANDAFLAARAKLDDMRQCAVDAAK